MTTWEEFLDETEREEEERMRPWNKLSFRKNVRRVLGNVRDFFRYRVWGSHSGTGIVRFWYWLECHLRPSHRFHVIDLRKHAGREYSQVGWIDRDRAMWVACFHLLCEYVEKENPFGFIDWDSDPGHRRAADEIVALYFWWKEGRQAEHDEHDRRHEEAGGKFKGPAWDEWCRRSDELEKKDDEMLDRLMKIRRYLWT